MVTGIGEVVLTSDKKQDVIRLEDAVVGVAGDLEFQENPRCVNMEFYIYTYRTKSKYAYQCVR